jgi:hypothetical protein
MAQDQDDFDRRLRRLEDIHEIHNLMGMHEYLHAAGRNGEEFEKLFAKDAPGVTFEPEDWGVFEGSETVKGCYVDGAPPADMPGLMTEHAATTPVIEIAEDGRSAKGVWISPGHETFPRPDSLPIAHWSWGRYGIDFVKEGGAWKFWHFHIYTTFRTPYHQSWVQSSIDRPPYFPEPGQLMEGMTPPSRPVSFNQPYHVDTAQELAPVPPVPYRTFDDTWSYTDQPT